MGLVRITSWYSNFNGSHFGLPPSEIHRMTGLPRSAGSRYCPLIQTLDAGYRSRAKCHGPVPNFRALSRAGAGVSDEALSVMRGESGDTEQRAKMTTILTRIWLKLASYQPYKHLAKWKVVF